MSIIPKFDVTDSHSFLAEELLIPNANKSDGGRLKMFTDHQGQALEIRNAEPPKVFTRFENQVGEFSSGYKRVDENYEVLKIIELNQNHKYIIIKKDSGIYDVIQYKSVENLTEYFGHRNELNPKIVEGAKIDIDEEKYIYKNGMYDDYMNLQYGRNLKAVFVPYKGLTYEDAIVISDEVAELMTHTEVKKYYVMLNKNDVLLNIAGNSKQYKPFLEIDQTIENGILCSRRRIDYNTLLYNFKKAEFSNIQREDASVFSEGEIKDIFVYSNIMVDSPVNEPLKRLLENQFNVYVELFAHLEDIKLKKGNKVSEDFNYWYDFAKNYTSVDSENAMPYTFDKKTFEGVVLEFTVACDCPCEIGSKLTGRLNFLADFKLC